MSSLDRSDAGALQGAPGLLGMSSVQVWQGDDVPWLCDPWPAQLCLPERDRRRLAPSVARLRWPYLTLRFGNAGATYRVDTCELGLWFGELVESWGP